MSSPITTAFLLAEEVLRMHRRRRTCGSDGEGEYHFDTKMIVLIHDHELALAKQQCDHEEQDAHDRRIK